MYKELLNRNFKGIDHIEMLKGSLKSKVRKESSNRNFKVTFNRNAKNQNLKGTFRSTF